MSDTIFNYAELPYASGGSGSDQNRFNWRSEMLLARNREIINGKVVVDLACNTGRLSYPCLALGAQKVIGIEARNELIVEGKSALTKSIYEDRMTWINSDVFDFLAASSPGDFDVILCFGFLYHTTRQVDFFRLARRLKPQHIIIDTSVAKNYSWYGARNFLKKPPALFMIRENPHLTSDTTDLDGVAFWPSVSFIEDMSRVSGYSAQRILYTKHVKNWSGLSDYRKGIRASWVLSRND